MTLIHSRGNCNLLQAPIFGPRRRRRAAFRSCAHARSRDCCGMLQMFFFPRRIGEIGDDGLFLGGDPDI